MAVSQGDLLANSGGFVISRKTGKSGNSNIGHTLWGPQGNDPENLRGRALLHPSIISILSILSPLSIMSPLAPFLCSPWSVQTSISKRNARGAWQRRTPTTKRNPFNREATRKPKRSDLQNARESTRKPKPEGAAQMRHKTSEKRPTKPTEGDLQQNAILSTEKRRTNPNQRERCSNAPRNVRTATLCAPPNQKRGRMCMCVCVCGFCWGTKKFATHFKVNGTPILAGVGQWAYSIVGICEAVKKAPTFCS